MVDQSESACLFKAIFQCIHSSVHPSTCQLLWVKEAQTSFSPITYLSSSWAVMCQLTACSGTTQRFPLSQSCLQCREALWPALSHWLLCSLFGAVAPFIVPFQSKDPSLIHADSDPFRLASILENFISTSFIQQYVNFTCFSASLIAREAWIEEFS